MGDTTTCVYQFSYNKNEDIIQYFIMHWLEICIKVDSYVAHTFYACSSSHNTKVNIAIKNNK